MNGDDENRIVAKLEKELAVLQTEHRKDIARLSERVATNIKNTRDALKLQATAYDKHLAELNHEAEQLKSMQSTYVPRETHKLMELKVAALELYKERTQGEKAWSNLIAIAAAIIAAASVIVNLIK